MFNETSYGLGAVSLTFTQQQIAARIIEIGRQRGEDELTIRAALSAGWVESRYNAGAVGDRGRAFGVFQMWPTKGWGTQSQVTDLDYSINRWYDEADRVRGPGMNFGQLAQAVERSAYPSRYGAAGGIVSQILAAFGIASSVPIRREGEVSDKGGSSLPAPETFTSPIEFFSGAPVWLPLLALGAAVYFILR